MELTTTYIFSQVFTLMNYGLLASSYFCKKRKTVLFINFLALIANAIAYIFLNAYTGLMMCGVAIIRNVIFMIDENKNGKRDEITKKDIIILIVLTAISIVSSIFTYDGFLSLFIVFATMLYTYSVWQKKTNVYKFCGIPIGIMLITYNLYIKSLFGIILETILMVSSTTGYILEIIRKRKEKVNV